MFFTMRLVKGRDLKEIFQLVLERKEGWNQTRALSVILKVCEAMAYAHDKGVIHRDLKPANVMVGRFGEVYVMDWGLARVLGRHDRHDIRLKPAPEMSVSEVLTARGDHGLLAPDSPLVTMDGDIVGTPSYMPPEQANGQVHEVGPQSDIYAVGAMLYQLLTGHMPYLAHGARASQHMVLYWVREGPPRPVTALNDRVPAELVAICEKAMARAIADRYPNMLALAEDLRAYLEHRVVKAYQTGAAAELRKWIVRNKVTASTIAAAILITITLLGGISLVSRRAERDARRQIDEISRLSDVRNLAALLARADELWPEVPALAPAMEQWLADAALLQSHLAAHTLELHALRERALPYDERQEAVDRSSHPRAAELRQLEDERAGLDAHLELATAEQRAIEEQRLAEVENAMGRLAKVVGERRTYKFVDERDEWHHATLQKLVLDLEHLSDPTSGAVADVTNRLAHSRSVVKDTVDDHQREWDAAIKSIADVNACPKYGGLVIKPQVGLVPIGRNARTGLWEFAHPRTGSIPALHGGELEPTEEMGLVLVLIPGGKFLMGAQPNPREVGFDRDAQQLEQPVHDVTLEPFFISKYEMSQGQWLAFTKENPACFRPRPGNLRKTLRNPIEYVSATDCDRVLGRLGLAVPTEAQWEYAARGGTAWPWWTGPREESLEDRANIFGSTASKDDTAPVGSFPGNPFGLHDTIGNVREWCREAYVSYEFPVREGDGLRLGGPPQSRVVRGGSFQFVPADQLEEDHLIGVALRQSSRSRVSRRDAAPPGYRSENLGVRPARPLQQ
jgi:formylglycine-generating enzyme required for sulfatase activity